MYVKFIIIVLCGVLSACSSRKVPAPVRWGSITSYLNEEEKTATENYIQQKKYTSGNIVSYKNYPKVEAISDNYVFVKKNDTAYSIAKNNNISLSSFIESNNLKPPYNLTIGQKLAIPNNKYYTVKKQDTLYSIAKNNKIKLSDLASMNSLESPYSIYVGQKLILPNSYTSSTPKKTASNYSKNIPSRTSSKFLRPISGKTISSFGIKNNGLHNDGINIAAPKGTPVLVAENGIVVYSSDKIKGLGNLILIKHDGGWITTYAHLDKILVKNGQVLKKGEKIGLVGNTGSVTSPQLHFEIRKNTKPVNPSDYF